MVKYNYVDYPETSINMFFKKYVTLIILSIILSSVQGILKTILTHTEKNINSVLTKY